MGIIGKGKMKKEPWGIQNRHSYNKDSATKRIFNSTTQSILVCGFRIQLCVDFK